MASKDILARYKTYMEDPTKQKKKKKKTKHATTTIIDESNDWGREDDQDEAPIVVKEKDFESQFKTNTWNVIQEGVRKSPTPSPDRGRSSSIENSPARRRNSPPPSPNRSRSTEPTSRQSRRSPSASPVRRRHSPDASPIRSRRSPSPSPTRRRKSPTASPERHRSISPVHRKRSRKLSASPEEDIIVPDHELETIHRDKTGKKIDLAAQKAELLQQRRKREAEEEAQMEWGKGLVQKQQERDYAERLAAEKNSSFANYADNDELNDRLKNVVRWGDTMAPLVTKTKESNKPRYKGAFIPNRYGIPPGYRWDGVDRSNGWELKVFQTQQDNKAHQAEYHRWATEDM
ncbi:Pre-mRNA-splicing factor cwc26 [Globomyces sp. JEL0801]|nr:Pre-mRNA-splicing factor cwc26 [Globomyces sp. JEL0801]